MATLSADGNPLLEEETRRRLQKHLNHWERHGYGIWMFRDRTDGQFVGYCGVKNIEIDGKTEMELLYALRAEYWGKGLATEMADAVLTVAFAQLDLANVVSYTLLTNRASQRVMEKVGFQYERDIVHVGLPHVFYRIANHQFSARNSQFKKL